MKIVLSGGGTAGHITPNIALLPKLKENFSKIYYIGSKEGMERDMLSSYPEVEYHGITTTKLVRRNIFKNLTMPIKLIKGINEAKKILKKINPNIIFTKGGYVSVPVAIAAKKLGIPLVCHESDLTLGLANKIISYSAKTLCTSFEETARQVKNGAWTGSPIRNDLLLATTENIAREYKLTSEKPVITIVGGSQGAKRINDTVESLLPELVKKFQIIHITGKSKQINFNNKDYHQEEFTKKIGEIFAVSDVVISRAGSNTIFELAVLRKPMLLIPLKKGNSRGDQVDNAKYFKKLGIANVLEEENLNPDNLKQEIENTIKNKQKLVSNLNRAKLQNGIENIVKEIKKAMKNQ